MQERLVRCVPPFPIVLVVSRGLMGSGREFCGHLFEAPADASGTSGIATVKPCNSCPGNCMSISSLLSPPAQDGGVVVQPPTPSPVPKEEDEETMRCDEAWKKLKVCLSIVLFTCAICNKGPLKLTLMGRPTQMPNSLRWLYSPTSWRAVRNVPDPQSSSPLLLLLLQRLVQCPLLGSRGQVRSEWALVFTLPTLLLLLLVRHPRGRR